MRGFAKPPRATPEEPARRSATPAEAQAPRPGFVWRAPFIGAETGEERWRYFAAPAQAEAEAERAAGDSAGGAPLRAPRTDGGALAPEVRRETEAAWGRDFSSVRVHAGSAAAALTAQHDALALAVGRDVHLAPDALAAPDGGRRTLAHELAHVAQQGMAQPFTSGARPFVARPVTAHAQPRPGQPIPQQPIREAVSDGTVVINHYSVSTGDRLGGRRRTSASLQMQFESAPTGRFAAAGSFNWFQTVATNAKGGDDQSEHMPGQFPPDRLTEFVDGRGADNQTAQLWDRTSQLRFSDVPYRDSLRDRPITWRAETSAVGLTATGYVRLVTYSWGFTIGRTGQGHEIPRTTVATPSAYHMLKFSQLPRRGGP